MRPARITPWVNFISVSPSGQPVVMRSAPPPPAASPHNVMGKFNSPEGFNIDNPGETLGKEAIKRNPSGAEPTLHNPKKLSIIDPCRSIIDRQCTIIDFQFAKTKNAYDLYAMQNRIPLYQAICFKN